MKRTRMGIPALLLAAVLALSGCGSAYAAEQTAEGAAVRRSSAPVISAIPDAEPVDVDTSAAASTDGSSTAASTDGGSGTAEASDAYADAFSKRDLAGTWDASTAVRVALNGKSVTSNSAAVKVSGSTAVITAAGTYILSGTLENGSIIVDAGKEDKVQLVLNGVTIHSETSAAVYVRQADKVFVTLAEGTENKLSNGGTFEAVDENNVDGVIFSKDDLTLNGAGKLMITSPAKHGVVCKDDLVITGGVYEVPAASHALSGKDSVSAAGGTFTLTAGKDGIHADNDEDAAKGNIYLAGGTFTINVEDDGISASGTLRVDGGTYDIKAYEGMEAVRVTINDGTIQIYASDDGINAARKSGAGTPSIEINGGDVTVEVGAGDTDCIDSNGNLSITGGTIHVTGRSTFDIDGSVTFTGGTVYVNGEQVDSIPRSMMGGRGGFGRNQQPGTGGTQTPGTGRNQQPGTGETQTPGTGRNQRPGNSQNQTPGDGGNQSQTPGRGTKGQRSGSKQSKTADAVTAPTQKLVTV